jgi:hypothetical protein
MCYVPYRGDGKFLGSLSKERHRKVGRVTIRVATDFPMMVLTESEDGHVIYSEGTDDARLNDDTGGINDGQQIAIVNDFGGGNTGPAPLQNDVIPDETF